MLLVILPKECRALVCLGICSLKLLIGKNDGFFEKYNGTLRLDQGEKCVLVPLLLLSAIPA